MKNLYKNLNFPIIDEIDVKNLYKTYNLFIINLKINWKIFGRIKINSYICNAIKKLKR